MQMPAATAHVLITDRPPNGDTRTGTPGAICGLGQQHHGKIVPVRARPPSLALELVVLDDPRAQTSHEPLGRKPLRFQKTWAASAPRGRRPGTSARSEADWMCRYIFGSLQPGSKAQ